MYVFCYVAAKSGDLEKAAENPGQETSKVDQTRKVKPAKKKKPGEYVGYSFPRKI